MPCRDQPDARSCTALSSSSPVIEALKLVTIEVESWSQTRIEAPASMWLVDCARTILTTITIIIIHHETCVATGDVVKFSYIILYIYIYIQVCLMS